MINQQQILALSLECPIVRAALERWSRRECTWEQALMVMVVALSAVKRDLTRQVAGGTLCSWDYRGGNPLDDVRAAQQRLLAEIPDPPQCPPIPEPPRYP
jgi:hypothetical protein